MLLYSATPWHWSSVLNAIMRNYLASTTICLLWPTNFEFQLNTTQNVYDIINIRNTANLRESFAKDVMDFAGKRQAMTTKGLVFNELVEKLTMSIDQSHCESFVVFEDEILVFIEAFLNASRYSMWRSTRNKFVFAYEMEDLRTQQHEFFRIVEHVGSSLFNLKTNKFVGPRADGPETMYLIDRYDSYREAFEKGHCLFPDKLSDLQGREVVLSTLEYSPSIIISRGTEKKNAQLIDFIEGTDELEMSSVYLDGIEGTVLVEFCEKYNCSIIVDISEGYDWGEVYPNGSGYAALGVVSKGKAEVSLGAMYAWDAANAYLELSMYIVRSGITCLVPAPRLIVSWLLPFQPFQLQLWLLVVACLSCEIFSLLFVYYCEKSMDIPSQLSKSDKLKKTKPSWGRSIRFAYSTTLKLTISQSGFEYIQTTSLRMLLFACFLNDIVITSVYSGGLASILTVPTYEVVADSLERLASYQLLWAANSVAWVNTIEGTDDPRMNAILRNFQLLTNDELYEKVKSAYMGFTVERLPFGHYAVEKYITQEAIDRFKIMVDDIYFQYTVAIAERLWPLLPRFNQLLCLLHSSGIDKHWEWRVSKDYLNSYVQKRIEASNLKEHAFGPTKLQMANFVGILLLWVGGVLMAIGVFVLELMASRLRKLCASFK